MSTQNEPLNTAPITQYIQQVKSAENSRAKEIKLDIQTAKNLAFTLGAVMSRLNGDLEKLLISENQNTSEKIEVKIDPGNSW